MTILNYSESRYYRHTGRAPFVGTTIATVAAWAAVSLLGVIYAYVQLHVKIVDLLSLLFVAGFAAAMAFTVYGVLRWARVRNMAVTALVSISAAVLGWYVSWVAWEHALLRQSGVPVGVYELFQRPRAVWSLAQDINEEGTFSMRKRPVKGFELWIAWAFEAAAVLGATIALPIIKLRDMAFCESCEQWCAKIEGIARIALDPDEASLHDRIEAKEFDYLHTLGQVHRDMPVHVRADLYACPSCPHTRLLTLSRVAVGYDKNGHRREKAKKIIDRLWIDEAQAARVRAVPGARELNKGEGGPASAQPSTPSS